MLLLTPSIRDLLVRRILGIVFFIKEHGHFWIFNFGTWGILHIHSHFCLHGLGEYPSGQGLQSPGISPHPSLTGTSAFSLLEDYSFIKTTRRIVFLFFFFSSSVPNALMNCPCGQGLGKPRSLKNGKLTGKAQCVGNASPQRHLPSHKHRG